MLIGRKTELTYLHQIYEKTGSQLLIVYGQNHIGKTSLLLQFAAEYEYFYYLARSCSQDMQIRMWNKELSGEQQQTELDWRKEFHQDQLFYKLLKDSAHNHKSAKKIIIIDEFQLLVKSGDSFMRELNDYLEDVKQNASEGEVLVILVSSSIAWIENTMVQKMGKTAFQISGLYKVKELSFSDVKEFFPSYSLKDCLRMYGVTGGVPGILCEMNPKLTVRENICQVYLKKNSFGNMLSKLILLEELRETSVYHTILETIASGKDKLNDIYAETNFSRAKISVYLKNLIQMEVVEKVFSYDSKGRDQAKKGVYRIKNRFISFWFTYVFPHLGQLEICSGEEFFDTYIQPSLISYLEDSYKEMCYDYLYEMNGEDRLPISIDKVGEWVGKTGNIDLILEGTKGELVTAFCKCDSAMTTYEDFEWNIFNLNNAQIEPDYIYLFSMNGFDERMVLEAKRRETLKLIDMSQMIFSEKVDKSMIE